MVRFISCFKQIVQSARGSVRIISCLTKTAQSLRGVVRFISCFTQTFWSVWGFVRFISRFIPSNSAARLQGYLIRKTEFLAILCDCFSVSTAQFYRKGWQLSQETIWIFYFVFECRQSLLSWQSQLKWFYWLDNHSRCDEQVLSLKLKLISKLCL